MPQTEIKSVNSIEPLVSEQPALFTLRAHRRCACEETGITHRPNDRHNVINFVSGDRARSVEAGRGKTDSE